MTADPSGVRVVIGGVDVSTFAIVGRVRISDIVNDAANTAALTIVAAPRVGPAETGAFAAHAFDPGGFATAYQPFPIHRPPPIPVGAPIGIYLRTDPERQIFGGQILTRAQYAELDVPAHVRYDLSCIDYTRRLDRRKVLKTYGQQSATAIVLDLIATFAPDITTANVQAALPTVDGGMTFTFEEPSRALSRVAEKIGGYWYVDYVRDLHFFVGVEPGPEPAPIVPGGRFADLKLSADLSQVRTRVIVEGDGSKAGTTLPSGDPIVPILSTLVFAPAGGRAKIGDARVTYTGVHPGGAKANVVTVGSGGTPPPTPPGAPTAALASATTAGELAGGPYQYAVTIELTDGARSDLGAVSNAVTIASATNPPPTGANFADPQITGPIAVGATATYATTFVDAVGGETAAGLGGNVLTGPAVPSPASVAFSLANIGGAGNLENGTYRYALSFLTATGETAAFVRPAPSTGSSAGSAYQLTDLAFANDGRVTGRRLYRSSVNTAGGDGIVLPWRHVLDVPNNTAGVDVLDGTPDAQLPARTLPTFSSAADGVGALVTVPIAADARVTRRRLYRKDGVGNYRLVVEIPDNATTTYADITPASGGALAPGTNTLDTGAVDLSNLPLGPANTARRRLFRTLAGGAAFREVAAIADNVTTTFLDTVGDTKLGGSPLPPQGGSGSGAPPVAAGSTTLTLTTAAGFPSAGWALVEEHVIRYGGVSGVTLTGIPATGTGSIESAIPSGTVVEAAPELVGVSPLAPVTIGDDVQLLAQVDDAAAQAAMAAAEGGDGVIEHYIQDRRLSETGATARARAELELFKNPELILSYVTYDLDTRSGRTVHVDVPAPTSLTGDFLIQTVTIENVATHGHTYPRRSVTASSTRFTFEDVLQRLLMEET